MPVNPTYPGVYIEEIPSGVRTITGVATSITAFVGRALRGPADKATRIQSYAEYERVFGGLWTESTMSYAVQHFFRHGGTDAIIVRVARDAESATVELDTAGDPLVLEAIGPGEWGNALRVAVDHQTTKDPANLYTLVIQELSAPGATQVVRSERFLNLSSDPSNPRYVKTVIEDLSDLVKVQGDVPPERPEETVSTPPDLTDPGDFEPFAATGTNGDDVGHAEIALAGLMATRQGIYALEEADLFNLLCIPPYSRLDDVSDDTLVEAAKYCKDRRAVLIIDPRMDWSDTTDAEQGVNDLRTTVGNDLAEYAAAYFPLLRMADPLKENRTETFAPCGAVAGIFARTDAQRGVWKAPAGLEASLSGVRELGYKLTDAQNGRLNPLGLNCLRNFDVFGNVIWGARTLAGADMLGSEWKYLPVRRVALYIEESLYRGTQWVVFEPNDEPLWAQIRLNVGAFMHNLFRQGAFQGQTPREAYFVKCDGETTTQNDINRGIVNILVGFAPLKPAEFVIIQIQQMAGQIEV